MTLLDFLFSNCRYGKGQLGSQIGARLRNVVIAKSALCLSHGMLDWTLFISLSSSAPKNSHSAIEQSMSY